jgi:hypothetical protein
LTIMDDIHGNLFSLVFDFLWTWLFLPVNYLWPSPFLGIFANLRYKLAFFSKKNNVTVFFYVNA